MELLGTASMLFEGVGAINHNFWEILKALLPLIVEKLQILEKKGGKDFKQLRFSNYYNVDPYFESIKAYLTR